MDVTKMDDEYVRLAQDAVEGLCAVTVPQGFIVEYIPILRHLPEWFPGFQFNKVIGRYKPIIEQMRNQPFDRIQRDMVRYYSHDTTPSFTVFDSSDFLHSVMERLSILLLLRSSNVYNRDRVPLVLAPKKMN